LEMRQPDPRQSSGEAQCDQDREKGTHLTPT
jgi:hypothetical protein